jgi:hypothetical protein
LRKRAGKSWSIWTSLRRSLMSFLVVVASE